MDLIPECPFRLRDCLWVHYQHVHLDKQALKGGTSFKVHIMKLWDITITVIFLMNYYDKVNKCTAPFNITFI